MAPAKSVATENREDISRFIVHLTRDDSKTFTNGASARDNLLAIMRSGQILASRPHCIFNDKLKGMESKYREQFNVACFTEVPLTQLHRLVGEIPGRKIKLEPYGVIFTKEVLISAGAQPAIYVNSYENNSWLREGVDELFSVACPDNALPTKLWRLIPFINAMHERYDFSWEREWRVRGGLKFERDNVVSVILPSSGEDDIKNTCAKHGIAVISPGWTYEQIVAELARQHRKIKSLSSVLGGPEKVKAKSEKPGAA